MIPLFIQHKNYQSNSQQTHWAILTSIFYIDDNIGITPDINNNALRMTQVIPLAIRTLARPLNASDVIPRKDIILLKKFKAEGRLEEVKKVLGWI